MLNLKREQVDSQLVGATQLPWCLRKLVKICFLMLI